MTILKKIVYGILCLFWGRSGLTRTINGFRLRLPVRYFRYFPDDYEAPNVAFLKQHAPKNGVVLDVGAHIGLFSTIAAQCVGERGRVLAYEPTPSTFKLLNQTIRMNKLTGYVQGIAAAVGSETGEISFYVSDNAADNSNSLVAYKQDRALHTVTVPLTSIDQQVKHYELKRVDFIKIDVEGAEYDTLLGAWDTMEEFRPAVILAIHPEAIAGKGDSVEDIVKHLERLPYRYTNQGAPITREELLANQELIDLHLTPLDSKQ